MIKTRTKKGLMTINGHTKLYKTPQKWGLMSMIMLEINNWNLDPHKQIASNSRIVGSVWRIQKGPSWNRWISLKHDGIRQLLGLWFKSATKFNWSDPVKRWSMCARFGKWWLFGSLCFLVVKALYTGEQPMRGGYAGIIFMERYLLWDLLRSILLRGESPPSWPRLGSWTPLAP